MVRPGFRRQLDILVDRAIAVHLGSLGTLLMMLAQAPIIGWFIGLAWRGQEAVPQTYFIMSVAALWMGCMNACTAIVVERPIFLRERMFDLDIQSYLLSKRIKERCGENSTILIYFYSNANCSSCRQQGFDILRARDDTAGKVPLVRIYSFDGDLGSPVANGLKAQFNVTQYPSMVINGALNSGTMSKDSIIAALKSG